MVAIVLNGVVVPFTIRLVYCLNSRSSSAMSVEYCSGVNLLNDLEPPPDEIDAEAYPFTIASSLASFRTSMFYSSSAIF